ncbi:MAG: hypothetical protein HY461_03070 [Parcubacteria group bacterium]|nr:hypothetical protein [Parcubacteria group bacterium]
MVRPMSETDEADFGKDHGVIHEMIVTGRKVGAGRNFYSALAHNEELFAKTVAFVARGGEATVREVVVSELTDSEKAAIAVLGSGKVLTQGQAKGETEFQIRYSEDTLRACAKENAEIGTDWRLVYLRGNSLREERERVGTNRKCQPCFYNNDWWLSEREADWATEKFEAGYYLIDFNGRFSQTSWQNQNKEVEKLVPDFERAHEAAVTEAALRIFEATGERLLPNWYHWGCSLDSHGHRVFVGFFVSRGWNVYDCHPDYDDFDLRVCLFRKFQK